MSNKQFAIIRTGGKQYKVRKGDKLNIEKLPNKEGGVVTFSDVLLYAEDKNAEVGTPQVKGVTVKGKVVEQGRGPKQKIYKYKKRKRYRKLKGHRQPYTKVEITNLTKGATQKSASVGKNKQTSGKTKQA